MVLTWFVGLSFEEGGKNAGEQSILRGIINALEIVKGNIRK